MAASLSSQGNEEFWGTATSSYDSLDWQKKLTGQVQAFIRQQAEALNLSSPPTTDVKVLDYACGPGVVSLAILPYVTQIRGLDVNPAQVAEFNRRATGSNFPPSLINADTVDLFLPDPSAIDAKFSTEEYNNFDYAFCSAALHHVDDPALGVARLAERVKPSTGRVVIIEFLERDIAGLVQNAEASGSSGSGGNFLPRGTEEERLQRNAEYRLHSHDNRHLQDFAKDFIDKGAHHGIYNEQGGDSGEQTGSGGHHHGHHGHHHHHHGKEAKESKEGGSEKRKHGHGPHGFKTTRMEEWFKDAGLVDVQSVIMEEKITIMGFGDFEAFMTFGRRA
ncbi:hypothetical protein H072_4783 [Dactylellina haptotyla CBS 200.50]|uniref:Methyltransferase domain-containing protein n=1 Tax=Dactylellina haptotyla (strain CBS 200.50) TaxID=1284197 RepID=S8C0V2_DACHA|nr:hypothetical protein H072_4783 [Dactylellina haptotyla CBS 200.50]